MAGVTLPLYPNYPDGTSGSSIVVGAGTPLPTAESNGWVCEGYDFVGYNGFADGSGATTWSPGDYCPDISALYGIWEKIYSPKDETWVLVKESSLTAIADALRAALGTSVQYMPSQFAAAINEIGNINATISPYCIIDGTEVLLENSTEELGDYCVIDILNESDTIGYLSIYDPNDITGFSTTVSNMTSLLTQELYIYSASSEFSEDTITTIELDSSKIYAIQFDGEFSYNTKLKIFPILANNILNNSQGSYDAESRIYTLDPGRVLYLHPTSNNITLQIDISISS